MELDDINIFCAPDLSIEGHSMPAYYHLGKLIVSFLPNILEEFYHG